MTDIKSKAEGLVDKISILNSKINSLPKSDREKLVAIQNDVNKSITELKDSINVEFGSK